MARHTWLGKLPIILEDRSNGNDSVHLDPALNGNDVAPYTNQADETNPEIAKPNWKVLVDGQIGIGMVGVSPTVMGVRIVSKCPGNIPPRQVKAQHAQTPCGSHPAMFFFKRKESTVTSGSPKYVVSELLLVGIA